MQKQEINNDCKELVAKLAELQDLKKEFDVVVEKSFAKRDPEINSQLQDIEDDMLQTLSFIEKITGDEYENKAIDMMEYYEKKYVAKDSDITKTSIAKSLAGLDYERAWEIREELLSKPGFSIDAMTQGLAGCDSEKAWALRERLIEGGHPETYVALSLVGLDTKQAWKMRDKFIKKKIHTGHILLSLIGCDSKRAWKIRMEKLTSDVQNIEYVSRSLAGLDSDRAWLMREFIKELTTKIDKLTLSLIGLDTEQAWKLRKEIMNQTPDKHLMVISLAGLDSDQAWKLRQEILEDKESKYDIISALASSLAGLHSDQAEEFRKKLLARGVKPEKIIESVNGDYQTSPLVICKNKK